MDQGGPSSRATPLGLPDGILSHVMDCEQEESNFGLSRRRIE
jgi:hypothetical protein